LALAINNTLKALYQGIRLDLGVIRPNQIFNSSAQFNACIVDFTLPDGSASAAGQARVARSTFSNFDLSNTTYSVHVPDVLYLTPVLKPKPMAQAITAVFVSTHSMLLAIWGAFSLIASYFATSRSKHGEDQIFVFLQPYELIFI
jgi:hypothetical protein